VLVIVLDGLRPDYVTADVMPNLHALGERGVIFEKHHAVYPTVTRVNSPSIATGSYPGTHGLLGNTMYVPEVNDRPMSMADANNLNRIAEANDGELLTTISVGEVLDAAGKELLAVSSGSTGSAMLLNHKGLGKGLIHCDLILPAEREAEVRAKLGEVPPEAEPNLGRNQWAVDAYLEYGLGEARPAMTLMWLSDPDHTAHEYGMGAPETVAALRGVDAEIGRIVATLEERGFADSTTIFVTSDHGFSTHVGGKDLGGLLRELGVSDEVVVAGDAIYVKDGNRETITRIVEALQRAPWAGAIFTDGESPNADKGGVPGTLSFQLINFEHPRGPDILFSPNWTDAANEAGFRGTTTNGGTAGHGSSSPYDIHNTLIVAGAGIKGGVRSSVASGNVDIVPTALHLLNIDAPASMDGRVLKEVLVDGSSPSDVPTRSESITVSADGYELTYNGTTAAGKSYFDGTEVKR
ncbi:MAG: alkaline phosphatase family protein, partial [Candidatus Hydrogenedentales bacterium]